MYSVADVIYQRFSKSQLPAARLYAAALRSIVTVVGVVYLQREVTLYDIVDVLVNCFVYFILNADLDCMLGLPPALKCAFASLWIWFVSDSLVCAGIFTLQTSFAFSLSCCYCCASSDCFPMD